MFILTHCRVNLEVLENRKLTPEEEALLLLGSFIPDAHTFKIVPGDKTHEDGLKFYQSLAKRYRYLGVGFILHGEKPKGLDYYVHKKKGLIDKKYPEISKIMRSYRKVFPKKMDIPETAHIITEFCFEYLTAEKHPWVLSKVHKAVNNPLVTKAVFNFANFFNIKRKYVNIMIKLGKAGTIENFVDNFRTIKGTAHNFQNFIFLREMRDKTHPGWFKRLTLSSYSFIKSRIKERQFEQMFARCVELVRKDYDPFLDKAIKNLKVMVKEHGL